VFVARGSSGTALQLERGNRAGGQVANRPQRRRSLGMAMVSQITGNILPMEATMAKKTMDETGHGDTRTDEDFIFGKVDRRTGELDRRDLDMDLDLEIDEEQEIRDGFAMCALSTMLAPRGSDSASDEQREDAARAAYLMADAMMAAR